MVADNTEILSKTAKKKAMTALQQMGETLVTLNAARLAAIPVDDNLRAAVLQAQKMKAGNALRRQLQYIGKLMRSADSEAITQALTRFDHADKQQTALLQRTEWWRDRLVQQGRQALHEFLAQYPDSDRQQLRQLLGKVAEERQQLASNPQLAPKYSRRLFKMLRGLISAE